MILWLTYDILSLVSNIRIDYKYRLWRNVVIVIIVDLIGMGICNFYWKLAICEDLLKLETGQFFFINSTFF